MMISGHPKNQRINPVKIYEKLGQFGPYQICIFLISIIPCLVAGTLMLSPTFLLATPDFRCVIDGCDTNQSTYSTFKIPESMDHCYAQKIIDPKKSCDPSNIVQTSQKCTKFLFSTQYFSLTFVSAYELVCAEKGLPILMQSLGMVSILIASFIGGFVSDRYGRSSIFKLSCPIISVALLAIYFGRYNVTIFATAYAISIGLSAAMYATVFVIVSEYVGVTYRTMCGNILQAAFAVGELYLAFIASLFTNFRSLITVITFSCFTSLATIFLPESLLWLRSKNDHEKSMRIVEKAAKFNRISFAEAVQNSLEEEESTEKIDIQSDKPKVSILDIWREPILRRWSINLFFNWAVNSMVYYGLSFEANMLGGNPYLIFACLAGVEIPFITITTYCMRIFGRRRVCISFLILAGIFCLIAAAFIEKTTIAVLCAFLGKGLIAGNFALIYVYTVEIYPTNIRQLGLAICSVFSRIGGILAPPLGQYNFFGRGTGLYFFGAFSLIAGILAVDLPETNNRKLPETLDDLQNFKRPMSNMGILDDPDDESETAPLI